MLRGCWRDRRALALVGVLLLAASSARAAFTFERPRPIGPERDEITACLTPGASAPDSQQIEAARALSDLDETNVAPRVGESRPPAVARAPARFLLTPRCALATGESEERLTSRSGFAEISRWCLAHATSTQAP